MKPYLVIGHASSRREEECYWHEVTVAPYVDPASGHPSLIITQSDVTGRAETEAALSQLNEVGKGFKAITSNFNFTNCVPALNRST